MGQSATETLSVDLPGNMWGTTRPLLPGLSVEFYTARRVRFDVGPTTDHLLMVHMGGPARAARRIDNQSRTGIQIRGEIDILPVGSIGTWDVDADSMVMRFQFTPARMRATIQDIGLDPDTVDLLPQMQVRDTQLEHISAAISHAVADETLLARFYGESLGVALLARIVTRFAAPKQNSAKRGLSKKQLQIVFDHIESHIDKPLSHAELAIDVGLSVPYFRSLFRRSMGMPVHQYVIRRRVEKAKVLLQQGRTISQAAADAGFADQSHLARTTRRILGLLPMEIVRLSQPHR